MHDMYSIDDRALWTAYLFVPHSSLYLFVISAEFKWESINFVYFQALQLTHKNILDKDVYTKAWSDRRSSLCISTDKYFYY